MISLMYKDPKIAESEWLQLTESERMQRLNKLLIDKKLFHPAHIIEPTSLKPDFLGGYSEEYVEGIRNGFSWEVKSKAYEFSLYQTFKNLDELVRMLKNSEAIHVHQVFELPSNYLMFDRFILWSKWVNDYLTHKGIEEGLHGNDLINIPELESKLSLFDKAKENLRLLKRGSLNKVMPKKINEIEQFMFKFFSMGIRADMYGPPSTDSNIKIGLEFRDVTRLLQQLKFVVTKTADSISHYSWERIDPKTYVNSKYDRTISIITNNPQILISTGIDSKTLNYFLSLVPNLKIGLMSYEDGYYIDYNSGELFAPTKEQINRIISAREYLIKELNNISRNIIELNQKKESYEKEDVIGAIQMTLTEWSRLAMISELYKHF